MKSPISMRENIFVCVIRNVGKQVSVLKFILNISSMVGMVPLFAQLLVSLIWQTITHIYLISSKKILPAIQRKKQISEKLRQLSSDLNSINGINYCRKLYTYDCYPWVPNTIPPFPISQQQSFQKGFSCVQSHWPYVKQSTPYIGRRSIYIVSRFTKSIWDNVACGSRGPTFKLLVFRLIICAYQGIAVLLLWTKTKKGGRRCSTGRGLNYISVYHAHKWSFISP